MLPDAAPLLAKCSKRELGSIHDVLLNTLLEDSPFYVQPVKTAQAQINPVIRYKYFDASALFQEHTVAIRCYFRFLLSKCYRSVEPLYQFKQSVLDTIKINTGLPVLVLPGFVDVDVSSV